jgi:ribosomal protein L29
MATDITKRKDDELQKELEEKRQALAEARFAVSGARSGNVKEARELRRNIARLTTELNTRNK